MQPQDFYLPLGRIENFNPSLRKSKPRENGSYQNLLSSTSQPTLLTTTINHGGGCRPLIIIIYWHASDRIWSHSCSGEREKTKPYSLVLGSYQWGKKYFSGYVQKMPKNAKFIAIQFSILECNIDNFQVYTHMVLFDQTDF